MVDAPKKTKPREQKTTQSGMMTETDYVGRQFITPKKGVDSDDDYDEENVVTVDIEPPTAEQVEIASRQEKFQKDIKTAKGGKHRKHKKTRKTRKVKKHGKRRH